MQLVEGLPDALAVVATDGRIAYANRQLENLSGYTRAELVGRAIELLVPDELKQPHVRHRTEYITNPRARPMGTNLEISLRRKDGRVIPADIALSPLQQASGMVVLATVRDVTERRRAQGRMQAVIDVTRAIMEGESDQALQLIAHHARVLAGAAHATVAVPEPTGNTLRIRAADGDGADRVRNSSMPMTGSLAGEAFRTGATINVADATHDPRAHQPTVAAGRFGPMFAMPLQVAGRSFGVLTVASPADAYPFGGESLKVVELFGSQAAVALEYARLRQELQRLAVLEDRERIAKELHDGVIQGLFAVGMTLQATEAKADDADTVRSRLSAAVESIDAAIRDLRNYIFGLRPGLLADRQLDQALRELATEFQERSGIVTVVDIDPKVAAHFVNSSPQLVQIAREALSNVARHAQAHTCRLSLVQQDDHAVLEVDDDGQGIPAGRPRSSGQGLRNMEERAAAMGAEFSFQSSAGQGTTVRVSLPL